MRVSSQRVREQRIVERLQGGALALARPSDSVVQSTPTAAVHCHGCLEPDADARVRDDPWHHLCVLFWQGRSESLRGQRIPHTQPGPGISPARPRWVMVVPVGQADTYTALRRRFARSPWVDVVMDRRGRQRRQDAGPASLGERRIAPRRKAEENAPASDAAAGPGFRLNHRGDDCEVYESMAPETGRCPECDARVIVELPRFGAPPVHLQLVVCHEVRFATVRHVVELQSFSPTGRVLLATRLAGRTYREPG